MKKAHNCKMAIGTVIILLVMLPTVIHAESQRIIVVVENASIRSEPDMTGRVIESPAFGSLFEVKQKVGDWYEVEFPSAVGVLVTGYIHEMFVEVEKQVPEPAHTDERRAFRVEARVGISSFTGLGGLELGVGQFAVDVGYLVLDKSGMTAGVRYYLKPSLNSWFIGLSVAVLEGERPEGYKDQDRITGIAVGRGWSWGNSWGVKVGIGAAANRHIDRMPSGMVEETALWACAEIALGYRF
jgi:hypothetical protein